MRRGFALANRILCPLLGICQKRGSGKSREVGRQPGSNPDTHQIGTGRVFADDCREGDFPSAGPTGHQLESRDPSLTAPLEQLAPEK
jgi:hypothetical protein